MRITRSVFFRVKQISRTLLLVSSTSIFAIIGVVIANIVTQTSDIVSAATPPPDSCFTTQQDTMDTNPNAVWITGYTVGGASNCPSDVAVPSTIGGNPVTMLGAIQTGDWPYTYIDGFASVTSLTLSPSVKRLTFIPDASFTAFTVPETVQEVYFCQQPSGWLNSICESYNQNSEPLISSTQPWSLVYTPASGITSVASHQFSRSNLKAVVLSPSITETFGNAFSYNRISSVDLGGAVRIGNEAFAFNDLTSLTLPNSVILVSGGAFTGNKLASVTLNEGLLYLNDGSFTFNQLAQVALPASLKSLGGEVHYNYINNTYDTRYIETTGTAFQGQSLSRYAGITSYEIQFWSGVDCTDSLYDDPYVYPWAGKAAREQCQDFKSAEFWYTNLITADPANPAGFKDYAGYFLEANKQIGGHLINAASATLTYSNSSGAAIKPNQTFTGVKPDGTVLSDYIVTNGPAITTYGVQDTPIPSYYRIDDTFSYTAPLINDIAPTPTSYSFVLGASTTANTKVFVYGAATAPATGEGLARTGMSTIVVYAAAVGVLIASIGALFYKKVRG